VFHLVKFKRKASCPPGAATAQRMGGHCKDNDIFVISSSFTHTIALCGQTIAVATTPHLQRHLQLCTFGYV